MYFYTEVGEFIMINDNLVHAKSVKIEAFITSFAETEIESGDFYIAQLKRVIDFCVALVLLPAVVPLLLIAALLIQMDGHSPFYGQKRLGLHGRHFTLWKLRTMVPDAEARLARHIAADPLARAEWQANQKLRKDPRITWLGRFLRKYSLDELPQLLNVLSGDMSLIGPRPMMIDQQSLYPGQLYAGLRPGLTGLWQISKRDDATFAARAQFDSRYAAALSWRSDLKIAVFTIGYLVAGRGC